jgi:hypothetical protein
MPKKQSNRHWRRLIAALITLISMGIMSIPHGLVVRWEFQWPKDQTAAIIQG